ncbi:histone deacetylase family protein [Aestuariivirga litoralis]|uniref:Histone deacetylase family protein n=1 Tax=Aestuariivirga litoralis TaxID=2650924 RepID=A0A2W2CBJ4_9HYPH|nr:histone deacetylase family protein [Aestuariivirga litoralis]PZF77553.1 histone deacetylase family protein [Aestuariivirga litoralis]
MRIFHSDEHRGHAGAKEMRYDELIPMCESPDRIDTILAALREQGHRDVMQASRFDLAPVLRVHTPGFVDFLQRCWPLWEAEFGPRGFATAYMFGMRGMDQVPNGSVHSMLSCYTFDVCVPFVAGTWAAIRSAVDVTLSAAQHVADGADAAFALCRPPGHHASADLAGGYCYVNNAAVAAQKLLDGGASRIAILDVDYHHGNGTQSIFYDRDDVLYASLHATPEREYPFLLGYARETGKGRGEGFNFNQPLPLGTRIDAYRPALATALARVRAHAPDVLVVSLGVDSYIRDPVGGFALESDDFPTIGADIAALGLPTLFVMEGGYAIAELGVNTANVITGFAQARG